VGDWCGTPVSAQGAAGASGGTAADAGGRGRGGSGGGAPPAGSEVVPGFRRYAMERLGEEACIVGLLRPSAAGTAQGGPGPGTAGGFLDVRDAAVLNLLADAAAALKLIYTKCGEEFPAHLVSGVRGERGGSRGGPCRVRARCGGGAGAEHCSYA
jgi:hypothetical protein